MVPHISTILQRFTGEWAMLLPPEAILQCAGRLGIPLGATACSRRSPPCSSSCGRFCTATPPAAICPIYRAYGSRAAAYCQAQAKLPLRFFDLLLERFGSAVQRSAVDDGRWHGHRTCLVDGSGCSMPDTPTLQEAFGQPTEQRPGCGVPVARLLGLFHAGTGVLLKLVVAPLLTHDLARVQAVHPS